MFAQENKIIIAVMRLSVRKVFAVATQLIQLFCVGTFLGIRRRLQF